MAKKRYLKGVVTDCTRLNLRKEPSTDGGSDTIIKVVDALTEVQVMEIPDNDEWYKVKYGAINGYCMKKFIAIKKGE